MSCDIQHISVCICTYKRPHLLPRLLSNLARQETNGLFTFAMVIADNDELRSAESVVSQFSAKSDVHITYCVESRQSIALARNKAIENTFGSFVALIDDDEFPADGWLLTLFKTCMEPGVDGVLGPVRRHFDEDPPEWVLRSNLYMRPEYQTGYVLTWRQGRSGNLFAKREMFLEDEQPFNPEFRTGEDQDFLRRMMERGRTFVWCNEAVVYETVPPNRWKRSFLWKRAFLRGAMEPRVPTFGLRDIAKSTVAVALYLPLLPLTLLLGQHRFMSLSIRLCDHLGKLLAVMGIHLVREEYVTE
jgi:glycosyltransferase involved in cell wall biosynthesis